MYALTLLPAAWLARGHEGHPTPWLTGLLVAGLAFQAVEAVPTLKWCRSYTGTPTQALFDTPRMTNWIAQHQRVFQYPSWYCGALEPVHEDRGRARTRISQLQVLAARLNKPNNSVHMARPLSTCSGETDWAEDPRLEPGTLYIVIKDTHLAPPRVNALTHSDRCVDTDWSYVCSAAPLIAADRRSDASH
jgi:hypothetical protein